MKVVVFATPVEHVWSVSNTFRLCLNLKMSLYSLSGLRVVSHSPDRKAVFPPKGEQIIEIDNSQICCE